MSAPASAPNPRAARQQWHATLRRLEGEEAALRRDLDPVWGTERVPVGRGASGPEWLADIKRTAAELAVGAEDERVQISSRVDKARGAISATLASLARAMQGAAPAPGHGNADTAPGHAGRQKALQERMARADAAIAAVKDHGRHRYGVLAAEEESLEQQVRWAHCVCLLRLLHP